jgi:phosphoglycerate dehydrogenase-like enzyme
MATIGLVSGNGFDLELVARQLTRHQWTEWVDWRDWDPATLTAHCRAVDAVVMGRAAPRLPDALITDRGRLRLLAYCHGSIRHLVSHEHITAGLLVSNWGDQVFGVAEAALALMLACLKQLPTLTRKISSDWQRDDRICQDYPCSLRGAKVGIYGFGPIGRHMELLLRPFAGEVRIYDPYAKDIPPTVRSLPTLRELFAWADIVSIHCGLNQTTQDSVTAELLDQLPQGGILINTARGLIVDEAALAERVAAGRLLCGVDVIRDERNWIRSPLMGLDGAILTGHIIGSGKGYSKGKAPPRGLPDFVVHNLDALDGRGEFINLISAEEYPLKT